MKRKIHDFAPAPVTWRYSPLPSAYMPGCRFLATVSDWDIKEYLGILP